jgi:hypothetical protein
LSGSHGIASLRAIDPEGSLLDQNGAQTKLNTLNEQDSKTEVHTTEKAGEYSVNYLFGASPIPTPVYHAETDNVVSEDTDSKSVL